MEGVNLPPASLEAKTKDELRQLMILNNRKHGKRFHYFDFTFAKGSWHCWFEITETERLMNGDTRQSEG